MNERPLLLLHGALGAASQFIPIEPLLAAFDVRAVGFPGHGGSPLPDVPFGIGLFADALEDYIEREGLAPADIFGYSMGGYVALVVARRSPHLIRRIMTLATKFAWDPAIAAREAAMLVPATIEAKIPAFAEQLRERHAPVAWQEVVERTAAMMVALGEHNALTLEDLAAVEHPVTIGIGDRDRMVTIEESLAAYRALPNGRFIVLPDTPHPLERVAPERLSSEIGEFFQR